jgi:hypothetical protein
MNIQVAQIKAKSLWKYDLNLQKIIYSQRAILLQEQKKSVWETKASDKLIDNISFHKSANKLMSGSLKEIIKDLKNRLPIKKRYLKPSSTFIYYFPFSILVSQQNIRKKSFMVSAIFSSPVAMESI